MRVRLGMSHILKTNEFLTSFQKVSQTAAQSVEQR